MTPIKLSIQFRTLFLADEPSAHIKTV